jgi:hypothetical protein
MILIGVCVHAASTAVNGRPRPVRSKSRKAMVIPRNLPGGQAKRRPELPTLSLTSLPLLRLAR